MSTIPVFYLEPDITGVALSNKVMGERHTLPKTVLKIIAPKFGAFYTESLSLYSIDENTGISTKLVINVDYFCVELSDEITSKSGKEVCFVILIVNKNASTIIDIDYQAYGGKDSPNIPILKQIIVDLELGNKPIEWLNIANRPKEYASAPHLHDSADLYGLEYILKELRRIITAVNDPNIAHDILNYELAKAYDAFKVILLSFTNEQIDTITTAVDACYATLSTVNTKLTYAQKKYDAAFVFYTAVNDLYLSKI